MKPLAKAATLLPPTAFRADPAVALTAFARYLPHLVQVETLPTSNTFALVHSFDLSRC
jgi:hypothetical protein